MKRAVVVVVAVAVLAVLGYVGAQRYADSVADRRIKVWLGQVERHGAVTYGSVHYDLFKSRTHIRDITVTPADTREPFRIGEVVILTMDEKGTPPTHLHVVARNITYDAKSGDYAARLRQLGYRDPITGHFELDYRYTQESKDFRLNALTYGADKVGKIGVKLRLGNIDLADLQAEGGQSGALPPALLARYQRIVFHNFELSYQDDSLVSRLLKLYSESQGREVSDIVAELTAMLDAALAQNAGAVQREAIDAVKAFLREPGTLSISIIPRTPLAIGRIPETDVQELSKILTVKVETAPRP